MFKEGDVVKYAKNWCTEGERKYRFVVLEIGLSMDRIKIGCLNSNISFGYVEVVDEEMIELA